ncbi:MAG TPA: M14 family zinc carboxypeptidase [Thermoanaerobaculia bacterium]|nr:M14 family zinc carboxypeptidase [Thermoanaerobaculia bacterium]
MSGIARQIIGLLALLACLAPIPSIAQSADVEKTGHLFVRVYFKNLHTAHRIAASFEPTESKYELGYLLLEVSFDEYDRLQASGLRVEIDPEAANRYSGTNRSIPSYSCYRTVEETFSSAQALVTANPALATFNDVGDSWEKSIGRTGYDLKVLKLTNSAIAGPKPKLLLNSGLHAREYTPVELALRFAESLISGYGTDADATWLLDYHEIHLLLQSNPDGRKKAEAGASWRKNVNENYCGATSSSRGADLNRNFAFMWGCCNGSSTNPCNDTYRGPSAASEPEAQALQAYMAAIFPDQRGPNMTDAAPATTSGLYIDLHSSGKLMLWPWGMTASVAPNGTALQTLGRKLAYFNGHSPQQSVGLYPTDGATDDHCYGTLGIASLTIELGTAFFESCTYFTNTLLPANLPVLKYAAKVARTPYLTPAGPETVSVSLSAGSTAPGVAAGTNVTLTASINDSRFNNTNGTEPSQNIAAAEMYVDTPPWGAAPLPIALAAADGAFSSTSETVTASLPTAGLSAGRHILFVRGKDAANNWGAVSAIFLYISSGGGNTAPSVTITAPANGSSLASGTAVTFSGTASDPQDGNLSSSLVWTSSLDGTIGSGASFSTSALSAGSHTITAAVTDSGSLSGSASISVTVTSGGSVTVTFYSVAAQDGRLWETTETTNAGGGGNSTDNTTASLRVGDFSDDTQYRSIVSFDTSALPDTATITAATLRLKRGTLSGTSPFTTHGTCTVDMSSAFGGSTAFAAGDFEAAATAAGVASMSSPAANGTFSTGSLNAAGRAAVNKTGITQFRVFMTLDDNDDLGSDYVGFYSGEAAAGNQPELVITYTP